MVTRFLLFLPVMAMAADWNPRAAADYLDGRQKEWFAWPRANARGTPCLSCHTGLPYLLARPVLRRKLGETAPTAYETGLRDSMRKRMAGPAPKATGPVVEAVLTALVLVAEGGPLSADARTALDRMWAVQGANGAWDWYSLDQEPWEVKDSVFYGASLAALTVGMTPADYRALPEVQAGVGRLTAYLRGAQAGQTLNNRLTLLWASTRLPGLLSKSEQKAILAEVSAKQLADGGWELAALGPFRQKEGVPAGLASDGYATAFTAFVMREAGVKAKSPVLSRALGWLRARQDAAGGTWASVSLNRKYPDGSNEVRFMQDAATAYAAMALLEK